MKLEDLIALSKAGFTKEDIIKLVQPSGSSNTAPEAPAAAPSAPAPAPEPAVKEEPKEAAPAEDIGALIDSKLSEAFKPFENLYNQIATKANMPTIGSVEPKGVDDILTNFFES